MTPKQPELARASARLTVQFAALMALLLVIVLGLVLVLFKISMDAVTEKDLWEASQLDTAQIAPSGIFVTVFDGGTAVDSGTASGSGTVTVPDGQPAGLVDRDAARRVFAGDDPVVRERTVAGRDYTTRTTRRGDRVVQVTAEGHRNEESLRRLAYVLLLAGGAALGVAVLAAHVMARRAIRPMAEALAGQRRFVAAASHELRTPLTLLSTRAQLLTHQHRDDVPAEVAAALDEMTRDSRTVTRILDDLLVAADPRTATDDDPVDLIATADAVVAAMRERAQARGITLDRSGSAERAVVRGSGAALARLCTALVANAIDYAGTAVTVRIAVEGRTAVVTVLDDGPGFAPDIVAHAFAPFVTGRPDGDHSGLGLAIVAEITRRHDGSVHIRPDSHGAVAVRLPLSTDR
ncbi:sensor histidine kinase [Actinoplanes palleronii]|uniref:histidine kinase n=1 Tax=Actinoplanes palleronii TaxID=113570 RepID=A0ABQ4B1C5_9ACTN|nr:HAMP domain-containing sensor histidine kinase [Actinoplanes palleronii]GIE64469.1 two-component sensor histidine kinase [Actinoplanes palleronii]